MSCGSMGGHFLRVILPLAFGLPYLCTGCSSQFSNPPVAAAPTPAQATQAVITPVTKPPAAKPADSHSNLERRPDHGVRFEEVAASSGVDFRYENGAEGKELIVEQMGGGAGWVDYDRDGFQDLYFVQGGHVAAPADLMQPPDRLFRSHDGLHFTDVTVEAGLGDRSYGQGISIGDFDNDGFDDIYVTNFGHNVLYRNQGDGTFTDVTDSAGVDDPRWSTSTAWADLDQDGDLDLYVCNYLKWHVGHPLVCVKPNGKPGPCPPDHFEGVPAECFMNQGDGTFLPQAAERGLIASDSKALGVAIADFNNDGLPDIFVAVDTRPNFLFINEGGAHFREAAVELGCATNGNGFTRSGMGVAVGDFDRNGFLDFYVTNFIKESNTLYRNLGSAGMDDVTLRMGLLKPTLPFLGFGTVMADFDQDGWPELFVANGHISDLRAFGEMWEMTSLVFTYREPARRWFEISDETGAYSKQEILGRAVATADYDNDGDLDLVVVAQNRPALLLRNDSQRGHWLKLNFIGRRSNRSAIGVRVTVRSGLRPLMQEVAGGTSYCSSHEHSLILGLGSQDSPCDIEIRWPSGEIQSISQIQIDQTLTLIEP